jgi:hypothetical protein
VAPGPSWRPGARARPPTLTGHGMEPPPRPWAPLAACSIRPSLTGSPAGIGGVGWACGSRRTCNARGITGGAQPCWAPSRSSVRPGGWPRGPARCRRGLRRQLQPCRA